MKKSEPILHTLLDTDLYKLTMLQAFLHAYPANWACYEFVCRNTPDYPLALLKEDVEAQLDHLCTLTFRDTELDWLSTKSYLKRDFIEFLRIFHLQRRYITVTIKGDDLVIVAEGPQIHVTGFEIYTLAVVNELYCRRFDQVSALAEGRARLESKIKLLEERDFPARLDARPFEFFEFGTRRRFSRAWQEEVVRTMKERIPQFFKGTSNLDLARRYNLAAIGTMAHEYFQTFQGVPGVQLRQFQAQSLETWAREYRGDLGIALTDTITMDAFLADFDLFFAKLFDGLRHDSGDPIVWGEKAIAHYLKLRIDPQSKRLVFSDALTFPRALEIHEHFADRTRTGFGIGTDLSNDMGLKALNIVMKLMSVNGQPVAKISDTPGKTLCRDMTFLNYLRQVFGLLPEAAA
jgi:nicotinate phosphoribosyltransferase